MVFRCVGDFCEMHFYEAMQIFAHLFGMPEIVTNCDKNELLTDSETFEIYAFERGKFPDQSDKNLMKRYLYILLTKIYGYVSPWGCMTGVRPTKIYHKLLLSGKNSEEAANYLKEFFLMSEEKILLTTETYNNQKKFLGADENACSFYLGVPFCPSICSYCTFGSSPIGRYKNKTDDYTDLLIREFNATVSAANKYKVESVYIGGGTPTTLSENQLERVLSCVADKIDISALSEFCVEAGRPDSITGEKLKVLKKYGVTRISVNPQTMNDKTLARIGRLHTKEAILSVFYNAREMGFDNINMDLIAGLPGENVADFKASVNEVLKLSPECITVHNLSLKRASNLSKNKNEIYSVSMDETPEMTSFAGKTICESGYRPFYMYRQKNTVGNNENVCYSKPGFESPYNIHIMEEDMTIFACGASAVTKTVENGRISRFFNMKSVEDYFSRFESELSKKLFFIY